MTAGAKESFRLTDKKKQKKKYALFVTNKSTEFLLLDCECVNGDELLKPRINNPPGSGSAPIFPFKKARHQKVSISYKSFNHVHFITFNLTP